MKRGAYHQWVVISRLWKFTTYRCSRCDVYKRQKSREPVWAYYSIDMLNWTLIKRPVCKPKDKSNDQTR